MCSHCLRASCYFFYGASVATRGKSVQRLCGDCTEIVQCQCSCRAVSAASARKSYGARAGIGLRTVPVRGLCNATYDMSMCYGLTIFFQICKNFSLNQLVEAAEPVNPRECRSPHGLYIRFPCGGCGDCTDICTISVQSPHSLCTL